MDLLDINFGPPQAPIPAPRVPAVQSSVDTWNVDPWKANENAWSLANSSDSSPAHGAWGGTAPATNFLPYPPAYPAPAPRTDPWLNNDPFKVNDSWNAAPQAVPKDILAPYSNQSSPMKPAASGSLLDIDFSNNNPSSVHQSSSSTNPFASAWGPVAPNDGNQYQFQYNQNFQNGNHDELIVTSTTTNQGTNSKQAAGLYPNLNNSRKGLFVE